MSRMFHRRPMEGWTTEVLLNSAVLSLIYFVLSLGVQSSCWKVWEQSCTETRNKPSSWLVGF